MPPSWACSSRLESGHICTVCPVRWIQSWNINIHLLSEVDNIGIETDAWIFTFFRDWDLRDRCIKYSDFREPTDGAATVCGRSCCASVEVKHTGCKYENSQRSSFRLINVDSTASWLGRVRWKRLASHWRIIEVYKENIALSVWQTSRTWGLQVGSVRVRRTNCAFWQLIAAGESILATQWLRRKLYA